MDEIMVGGIVTAWQMPHPPIAVPEVGRGREAEISGTLRAMREASDYIVRGNAGVIILISPHAPVSGGYISVSGGGALKGDLGRFGARGASVGFDGDGGTARMICEEAGLAGVSARISERVHGGAAGLDHGSVVPLYFINEALKKSGSTPPELIIISIAYLSNAELYRFGACVARAATVSGKRAALITSGDLSHKLTADGPYGFDPAGPEFDKFIMECIKSGDAESLLGTDEMTLERAAQCGFYGLLMLYGAIGETQKQKSAVQAGGDGLKLPRILSYEGVFGVGYAIAQIL